ncbi:choline transporter-like protein 1 [Homalodisca vitripennis]|uniref:choline transporter-like protein 1 n=1 Tax=Homalodisca vitripennis TaxID=197043 RepID=UPI001EEA2C92|nr:choline transporter-like protein 1 [Homalodisca vitripennis]
MGSCFSQDKVEPIAGEEMDTTGSSYNGKTDEFDGPTKRRGCTDAFFLVLFIGFIIGLFVLVGYCVVNGDVFRIVNGYDNCGNICGRKNEPLSDPALQCFGKDMTDKKFVQISGSVKAIVDPKHTVRKCVVNCNTEPGFVRVLNRCVPNKNDSSVKNFFSKSGVGEFFQEVSQDLHLCWREILILCLIAFVMSLVLLFLFRYVAGVVVWLVLIAAIVTSICATIYLWIMWRQKHDLIYGGELEQRKESSYFTYAIISTIITIIVLLLVWVMRKRIQLVVQLFQEAGKAVSAMPLLLSTPVLTFCTLAIVVTMWLVFELWIESSGYLRKVLDSDNLYYKKDAAMKTARVYNLLAMLWFTQFCIGCQQMVIAGAVATWFFTRNKSQLGSPIGTSFSNLVFYHLGSVALGSLLIALVQLARIVLKFLQNQLKNAQGDVAQCIFRACQCCLYCFEKFLAYLTRNAFIEVAIYGENFCRSGQQAFKMLSNNALRVAAINSVGDFVLFLGKVFVVLTTVLIGTKMFEHKQGLQHVWVPLAAVALFAALVSHCFITVYEMVIDTIFICFCEDCELNDGISKPYFMSKGLMEYVENSKKVLAVGDGTNRDWSGSTDRAVNS